MPRRLLLLACLLVVLAGQVRPGGCRHHARAGGLHPGNGGADPARPSYKSPLGLAVDRDGKVAYVALQTAGAVAVVDLHAGKVLEEIAVGGRPHDLALAGKDLFVTCEQADTVVRVSTVRRAVTGRWTVGQAPRGVAVLPDGSRVFVACHDERALCTLDVASGKVKALPLPGWPDRLALDISDRPPTLLALSAQPGEALVSLLEPGTTPRMVRTHRFAGVTNPRGLTGLGLAGFGAPTTEVLLVHQRPRTKVPATQVAQGWVFTNAISRSAQTAVLDDPTTAYADPSDVVVAPDSRLAFVACAGADTVLAVRLDRFRAGGYGSRVANHTAAKDDLTAAHRVVAARLATQANPRRLALSGDGKTLVVSNHLADSLTVIDTQTPPRVLRHISLGGPPPDAARRGEVLFHSGRMTFQGQFTCASCHPGGGSDGLTWDLARDGVGNFLNTRALWGVRGTAPYGWHASSPTLADRVASTLRHTHQHEPQGTEVEDLVAYLKTLDWPRPLPDARKDSEAIARGRALFEGKGKCSSCHHGDDLYGETPHDVGTRTEGDISPRFDTPALRGLGRTAPYLHHGKASTLEEVLTTYNPAHRHGAAHLLSKEELADLLAYLHEL